MKLAKSLAVFTKRTLISEIAKLYDPLVWIAPILIVARLMMWDLWLLAEGWDGDHVKNSWMEFNVSLPVQKDLGVRCWYGCTQSLIVEIHAYLVLSMHTYAASFKGTS